MHAVRARVGQVTSEKAKSPLVAQRVRGRWLQRDVHTIAAVERTKLGQKNDSLLSITLYIKLKRNKTKQNEQASL